MHKKRMAVAVSGGTDSAAAALLMQERGFEVVGFYMQLSDGTSELEAARHVADTLGIEFYPVDLRQEFDEQIKERFVRSYLAGETPNPCVECNRLFKFGVLLGKALEMGCQGIATGHYAECDGTAIRRAAYAPKDQSYCLWRIPRERLGYIHFPLAGMTKPEVKAISAAAGLVGEEKKESMDICFIPNGDYRGFIDTYTGGEGSKGRFLLQDGSFLAESRDQRCYTVGQRKGLGIAYSHPLYVLSKDATANTVTVGSEKELYRTEVRIRECNWQQEVPCEFDAPVCLRFRAKEVVARIQRSGDNARLVFRSPVRAPSPGQSAVVYSERGILLGGGIICP